MRGLTVGMSRLNQQITGKGSYDGRIGIPATPHYVEYSKHDWTNQYYGQLVKDKFHADRSTAGTSAIRSSSMASPGSRPM